MSNKLIAIINFKYEIKVKTGLHIGGSKLSMSIGGVDTPVTKDKNNKPYIPGSSVKGKMRSLLAKVSNGSTDVKSDTIVIKKLFGLGADGKSDTGFTRLKFADAFPRLNEEGNKFAGESFENAVLDYPFTEVKFENVINRLNGGATPRQIERVPNDASFDGNFTLNIYEGDDIKLFLDEIIKGFSLIEYDYLGGHGSRGYGRVEIIKGPYEIQHSTENDESFNENIAKKWNTK